MEEERDQTKSSRPTALSLTDSLSNAKKRLKPTATVERRRDGKVTIARANLLTPQEQRARKDASINAGKARGETNSNSAVDVPRYDFFPQEGGEIYEFYPDVGVGDYNDSNLRGEWMAAAKSNTSTKSGLGHTVGSIRVATFNIWFDEYKWKERLGALLDLLVQVEMGDVICLQEVTPRVWVKLLENPIIRRSFRVTDNSKCATLGYYGVAMLIRRRVPVPSSVDWIRLPTRMGRAALVVKFDGLVTPPENNNFSTVAIATVHLESLRSQDIRAQQVRLIHNVLKEYDTAMLLGDYNITATGPHGNPKEHFDVLSAMNGFNDLWIREHGTDGDEAGTPGHSWATTFNASTNTMHKRHYPEPEDHSRLDRIMIKEQAGKTRGHSIRLIGNQPIGIDLYISDHFGLVFDLELVYRRS